MSDDIRLYLKVNELIESNNEHSEALRQLGNLFLEMHNQPGIWGFLGRATFAHYVKTRGQQPFARLKLIDTPPMLPKENDRADDIYPRRSIDAS